MRNNPHTKCTTAHQMRTRASWSAKTYFSAFVYGGVCDWWTNLNVLCRCFCSLLTWLLRTLHIKSTPRERLRGGKGEEVMHTKEHQVNDPKTVDWTNPYVDSSVYFVHDDDAFHRISYAFFRLRCVCEQSHVVECSVRDSMSSFLSFVLSFSDASFDCWVNCVGCRSVIIQFTKWCLKLSLRFAKMQKWKTNDEWTTNTTLFTRCTLHTQSYIFSRV